ncbi:MAG: putative toxin-antitoxin system toxin component, PIN family [Candidatus Omnitrophica bacterium]|nr:putative toxin-antitoxin system toxin component, PIN family [Candidatus Omnitrophota bacterium]MCA9441507.1 putative toxin-antitoxin system toxin component, PIN family [Candidatus Omnitrophota bacterium]
MVDRVVIDTNVWISGLLWRGTPHQIVLLARAGVLLPIISRTMVDELLTKLQTSFDFSKDDLRITEKEIYAMSEEIEITGEARYIADDPKDDQFVECAILGRATAIVSGDKHLLNLGTIEGIPILNPKDFLMRMGNQ